MAIAQGAQAIATFLCLGGIANLNPQWTWTITDAIGYQWTLVAGAACWSHIVTTETVSISAS